MNAIDCACVIHGTAYSWTYVERLYNMLCRNLTAQVNLHVFTEAQRPVPEPWIKHSLEPWLVSGPRKSWWYKMQLFDPQQWSGPLLYFDLDTVIVNNIDWITHLDPKYFWAVRDFKYLWRPHNYALNSSVMWWDTRCFHWVYEEFLRRDPHQIFRRFHGDQDFLNATIDQSQRRLFDHTRMISYRWQALDGGYWFARKTHLQPGSGVQLTPQTSVLIFHGHPKPEQAQDPVTQAHWQ